AAARRRRHEAGASPVRHPVPNDDVSWREVQALFEEELQRLPGAVRAAFVLCCLENKSAAEAARELGLKEGTVANRVSRARRLLRERLSARGVSLAALLGVLPLTQAAAPARLVVSTTHLATLAATGRSPA